MASGCRGMHHGIAGRFIPAVKHAFPSQSCAAMSIRDSALPVMGHATTSTVLTPALQSYSHYTLSFASALVPAGVTLPPSFSELLPFPWSRHLRDMDLQANKLQQSIAPSL